MSKPLNYPWVNSSHTFYTLTHNLTSIPGPIPIRPRAYLPEVDYDARVDCVRILILPPSDPLHPCDIQRLADSLPSTN